MDRHAVDDGAVQDAVARVPAVRSPEVQRDRRRRVAQRERRRRHGPRLDRRSHPAHPAGLRLGRRLGPGSRRERRDGSPRRGRCGAQEDEPAAVRDAPPSRRRLLLRHLLPGGPGHPPPGPRLGPRRAPTEGVDRRRRVAVGLLPHHLHRRRRPPRPRLQRLPRPQPVGRRDVAVGIARPRRPRTVPDRPRCPRAGLRDRDRPRGGVRRRPPAGQQMVPGLGGGGDVPCRRLPVTHRNVGRREVERGRCHRHRRHPAHHHRVYGAAQFGPAALGARRRHLGARRVGEDGDRPAARRRAST